MKLLVVLALAALAAAKIPSQSWESETFPELRLEESSFKRGSEYQFRYNGQVATGIPGASRQHAATRIQALVSLVLKGEQKALLKIHHIRMGKLNQDMYNPREMVPFMAFEEVEVSQESVEKLQLPVMFNYEQGVVSALVFDGQEQPWSANIKKGILNMLQVNLGKRNQIRVSEEANLLNRMPESEAQQVEEFFATQEKSVEGECETLYTVVRNPKDARRNTNVLNVTRSIDFENCKQRPEIKYNFRFQDPCEACDEKDDQKFLKSSSVAKFNISGDRESFLIESAILESQYQLIPFNREGNMIATYVNQTLVLLRSGPISSKNVKQPKNPQQSDSDLMYTMDWDKEMEEFLMKGHNQARLPVDIKDRVKIVSEILRPLVSEMRECVSEEVPLHYARLIKTIRFAEKTQIQEILEHFVHSQPESFSQEEHQKIRAILTDALADAATKDSISTLLELIKEEKLSPLRASITIKHLNNIRTPSKEIVREFMSFLESPVVEKNFVLKQAAYLTLGSIVQGLCMPSEERLASLPRPSSDKLPRRLGPSTHLCPQQLQDQILEKLFNMVERVSEEDVEESVLALKTIGNMGLPKSILRLEKIIRSQEQKYPEMIRIEAIVALRQLRESLPQKVREILMPIFMNKQESNSVRMAAVYQIFQTQPSRPVLEQVARALFAERSQQVASFVYSYMTTVANTTNPCEKKFAQDLQLALRHGRKISGAFMPQYSKFLHGSVYSQKFRMGSDASFASVISNRTLVPKFLAVNLHLNAAGFWSKNIVAASIAQENVESLFARVLRRTEFSDISLDDILARSPRAAASPVKELQQLWKKLETVARQTQGLPKAFATLKLKDQVFFMAPLTQKSLRKLPSVQQIRRILEEGTHFNIHKAAQLHEMEHKIPTSMGMPIVVSVRIPTVAQISGQVRVDLQNPFKVQFNNVKPSMAASVITTVSIFNPIVASGLKIVANAKVCAPVSGKVVVDIKSRMPSLSLSLEPVEKEMEWVRVETRPMTFTRVYRFPLTAYPKAQYKTIVGEQWNRIQNIREIPAVRKAEQMIEKVIGQKVRVESVWHKTPVNAPTYLPVCPLSGPNHFVIRSEPTEQLPKEYVLKISAENIKSMSKKLSSKSVEMDMDSELLHENYESKGYETTFKTELFTKGSRQERKAEMETRVSFSPNLRIVKAESEITVSPVDQLLSRPVKACFRGFVQYPEAASSFSELRGKSVVGELKTTWGQDQCKEENKVEIKLGAKHSQEQEQSWSSEPEYSWYSRQSECESEPERCSPVHLQEPLHRPQELLTYVMSAEYNNVSPILKNATAKVFRALKNYYYWNTNEINFDLENPENTIRAKLTIDTRTRQFFNLTIKTPVENITFTDAQLPIKMYRPISIRRIASEISSPADLLENLLSPVLPVCRINSQRVQTFDRVSFRAPLSNCWTLLAKDCETEDQSSYAVLAKQLSPESAQKALKIVTQKHTVVIEPESRQYDSLKIKVNGKQIPVEELPENEHIRIQKVGQTLKITLPQTGIRVTFDGYSAKVQMSPLMASNQCGLCGHYDSESRDEFRTPKNEMTSDVREFLQSYTLKDNKCDFPEQLNEISSSSEELSYQPEWEQKERYTDSEEQEQEQSQERSSEEWARRETVRPVRRTVAEEEGRKLCFSAEQIPRCPRDSFPAEYETETRQLSFRCIRRDHQQAHRFLKIAREESRLPEQMKEELQKQETAYSAEYSVPKICRRNF